MNPLTRQGFVGTLVFVVNGRKPTHPRVVAKNIIADHGRSGFQKLIEMFRDHESGTKIGFVFGVSRQRVNQWKSILGEEHVTYVVNSTVADLLESRSPKATRRTAV